MKVAIIEADHFQYGLTQSKIFEDQEKLFFVTPSIKKEMSEYHSELCTGTFHTIESIEKSVDTIIKICNSEKIDLLLLSPVFGSFEAVLKIAENIHCKKVITIHNLNFWLYSKFRTLRSYKERELKRKIVDAFDYVAVEDFIYAHVKNNEPELFKKYKFLYIPFTIFYERNKKYNKEHDLLKVVLPGSIHKDRRRYENVIEVIRHFALKKAPITFSFAGKPLEEYGKWVIAQLEESNKIKPGIVSYFAPNSETDPDLFLKEMETSDLVLSTSTTEFKALGTTEFIGKTKPTAAIHDMMSFQLPGLLPSHLMIPENLKGSVFNYNGAEDLENLLQQLLDEPQKLSMWKKQAQKNSYYFTASEIRRNLPFFYNICNRCVMDNTNDPEIWFNKEGNCNYCSEYYEYIQNAQIKNEYKLEKILPLIDTIREEGKNKKYDCIVGVSGGTDSAYLVYTLVEMNLRPLVVHYDNSWNSETATQNIEMLLKKLNIDLYTHVNDWEEFKDLQLSFLKAGVIDIELITDQAIIALLYNIAEKYQTKYIFSGHNTATEFILPKTWYHWKLDALNILAIHKKYGKLRLKSYPLLTYAKQYIHNKIRKTRIIHLLNYLNYDKAETQKNLTEKYGWKNYGAKHNESIFTRFYQNYILPVKFNVDKRKAHLSSLICSGQVTREQALKELEIKIWEAEQTKNDKSYVIKKLGVSEEVFDKWMKEEPKSHLDYPSYLTHHDKFIRTIKKMIGKN
jgi:N-acetyl sugar amidotransferase